MILIALGANLPSRYGSPVQTMRAALQALKKTEVRIIAASRIWQTSPVPVSDQPDYYNAVVQIETEQSPAALLATMQAIEQDFGRTRHIQNAARVLDMDLLAYNDQIIDRPGLIVPHPRMHQRGFVLLPLYDVAPDWIHPVLQETLAILMAALPEDQTAHPSDETL